MANGRGFSSGAELDLLALCGGKRVGFEVKHVDAPRPTKSMHVALADLELDHLFVVYPGDVRYPLLPAASAMPIADVPGVAVIIAQLGSK